MAPRDQETKYGISYRCNLGFCDINYSNSIVGKAALRNNLASSRQKVMWICVSMQAYPLLLSLMCSVFQYCKNNNQ